MQPRTLALRKILKEYNYLKNINEKATDPLLKVGITKSLMYSLTGIDKRFIRQFFDSYQEDLEAHNIACNIPANLNIKKSLAARNSKPEEIDTADTKAFDYLRTFSMRFLDAVRCQSSTFVGGRIVGLSYRRTVNLETLEVTTKRRAPGSKTKVLRKSISRRKVPVESQKLFKEFVTVKLEWGVGYE